MNQVVLPEAYKKGLGGVASLLEGKDSMAIPWPTVLICIIFTFWLAFVVFHTASDGTDVNFTALAVGLYITVAVYAT